ncbi:MAG: type VI-A CRISPR-associated RNA-guided ribonuclease Cas13a [Bacteroidales bacterium]|jgi:hypothetical protein|nr:type VI-A CRISPR-associated RNA-guided ribonuclease Cas13a [Bacteroidales bacterium]
MRITKVKVKNKTVLMHRTTTQSDLVFDTEKNKPITEQLLPDEKRASFLLSIKNKTILKKDYVQKPLCESCKKKKKEERFCDSCVQKKNYLLEIKKKNGLHDYITYIIENTLYDNHKFVSLQNATKDDIRLCLNPRFQQEFTYYTDKDNKEKKGFNLVDLLFTFKDTKDYSVLAPYKEWAEWYIKTKSEKLIQSVTKNIIPVSESQYSSTRKKALQKWKDEFLKNGTLHLKCKHSTYQIDALISDLQKEPVEYNDKGFVNNKNEYHRNLKKALQKHQSERVFGKADNPKKENRENVQLQTYHAEIVKYLEHYFSVKRSNRNNTKDDVQYYLDKNTIKSTILKQLENAMRNFLLQEGKYNFHNLTETTDSDTLSLIKQREAFVLNLISVCAFASNNIRNIVDTKQINDILGKTELENSLEKNSINTELFQFFFNYENELLPEKNNDAKWKETMWAMRRAVQKIRNNIIHYEKDALNTVFFVETFENEDTDTTNYTDTVYKDYLCKDIASLNESLATQLTMNGVLEYYNIDLLQKIFEKCSFSLIHTHIPFTPGFKKTYKQGCNYQEGDDKKNSLELAYYMPRKKEHEDKEEAKQFEARYFMLKLLYKNMFLPYFTDEKNKEPFKKAVDFVLKNNKDNAQNNDKRNNHKYAFNGIKQIKNEKIEDYLKQTQSNIIHEYNKKKEQQDKQEQEVRHNFEKFLLQVFIKGFDSFLQKKFPDKCINNTQNQFEYDINTKEKNTEIEKRKNAIKDKCTINTLYVKKEEGSHIAFYVLCKLLDANYLSTLRNELIKFRQCTKNDGEFAYNHLLEIIEICLLQADVVKPKLIADKHKHNNDITAFIESSESLEEFGEVYVQTDEQSPVVHKSIALIKKYGTYELLTKLIKQHNDFTIKKSEYEEWKRLKEKINTDINTRVKIHEEWVKTDKKQIKKFFDENAETYQNLCDEIGSYNWLDNKLHCEHLRKLHSLIIEVLGRMAGFIALWERDFVMLDAQRKEDVYQLVSFFNFRERLQDFENSKSVKDIVEETVIKRNDNKDTKIAESEREELKNCIVQKRGYYKNIFFLGNSNVFPSRNHIAHYNYLTKTAEKSIIELIQELRALLCYDRKLKNAVTKSIIKIFDKHGMTLKFKFKNNHELALQDIKPKEITHMKSKDIKTKQVSKEYCDMCEKLLRLKK